MSSVSFVNAKAIRINEINYAGCPADVQVPCEHTVLEGLGWAVPVTHGGVLVDYDIRIGIPDTDIPEDAVHVQRLRNTQNGNTYWIVIEDAATEQVFVANCNACCGATPSMPAVTIPDPIIEICPCPESVAGVDTYTFTWPMPANPNGLALTISGTFNQAAGTPAPAASYADEAALLTFLNTAVTGWDAYGTWSYEGAGDTQLQLVSTTVLCAGISIGLVEASYCMLLPAAPGEEVNGITIGGEDVSFPNVTYTEDTPNVLINAIKKFLIGTFEVVDDAGDIYVKYTGLQVPSDMLLDGAAVAGQAFTTGACP